jgi:hypothetical protein
MGVKMGVRTAGKGILLPGRVIPAGNHVGLETKARRETSPQGKARLTMTIIVLQRMNGLGSQLLRGILKNGVASRAKATRKTPGITSQTRIRRGRGKIAPASRSSSSNNNRNVTGVAMMTASTSKLTLFLFLQY